MSGSAGTGENDVETPVPFAAYAQALKGTPDEVYTKLLRIEHGGLPRPPSVWAQLLNALRSRPAA